MRDPYRSQALTDEASPIAPGGGGELSGMGMLLMLAVGLAIAVYFLKPKQERSQTREKGKELFWLLMAIGLAVGAGRMVLGR